MSLPLPRITQTRLSEYVINVKRDEIKTYIFGEHSISIARSKPEELKSWERQRIEGEVDDDGYIYFVEAQPEDPGLASFIWLTKEEAIELDKQLREM
jgi:hypothetical protein